ncbi:cubilin [Patella vulgata]|uniref:cubilin n=1 Tax=Patella vulgata TaxID=6465 RepID=UPI00217F676F|nr:cubilin [Patella vulgata]
MLSQLLVLLLALIQLSHGRNINEKVQFGQILHRFKRNVSPPVCGVPRRKGDVTRLDHPGTGGNYGNNETCEWTICTNTPGVNINIIRMDVEVNTLCRYDAFRIESPQITVCGNYLGNFSVATTMGCINMSFTSDGSLTGTGFTVDIKPLQNFTRPTTITPPISTTTNNNDCGVERKDGYSTIIDYPGTCDNYGNNETCEWTVCTNTHVVNINITRMDIQEGYRCGHDALIIRDTKYCGSLLQNFDVPTSNDCIKLRFTSDGSISRSGFTLTVTPKQTPRSKLSMIETALVDIKNEAVETAHEANDVVVRLMVLLRKFNWSRG